MIVIGMYCIYKYIRVFFDLFRVYPEQFFKAAAYIFYIDWTPLQDFIKAIEGTINIFLKVCM